jgi:hypothetical protein
MLSRFERHQTASYGAAAVPSKTMCRQTLTTPDSPERHRRFYLAVVTRRPTALKNDTRRRPGRARRSGPIRPVRRQHLDESKTPQHRRVAAAQHAAQNWVFAPGPSAISLTGTRTEAQLRRYFKAFGGVRGGNFRFARSCVCGRGSVARGGRYVQPFCASPNGCFKWRLLDQRKGRTPRTPVQLYSAGNDI